MSVALVTGSGGLVGSQSARHLASLGLEVVGVDNDMRAEFFGPEASTAPVVHGLQDKPWYRHSRIDVRDRYLVDRLFAKFADYISVVVHAAGQPSHDWSATDPATDWDINATGTLNILEAARTHCPGAVVVVCSTNKVYGDRPNTLPLVEHERRYDLPPDHPYADGVDEDMSVDACLHSPFGVSKLAADVMAQEYGRYFGLRTVIFRGGTLTGSAHAGAELHGFLAYLTRCVATGRPYRIIGYRGKQVRDAIHARDVATAFEQVWRDPPEPGSVFNLGGGRHSNVSVLEALDLAAEITGREPVTEHVAQARIGDHQWWVSSMARFRARYPGWVQTYDVKAILTEINEHGRWPA